MKMKYVDYGVSVLFIVALIVIYFFWACGWDSIVTIVAGVIAVAAIIMTHSQFKKIKELSGEE